MRKIKTENQSKQKKECIHALTLIKRQKRSLYEAKKYFQQKLVGIKHNGNKVLRMLAA